MARCAGVKADGTACERIVSDDHTWCYAHDPSKAEARSHNASKAGRVKTIAGEVVEIRERIRQLAEDVIEGRVDKGKASVAFQGLGVAVKYFELQRRIKETDELLQRIEALEEERRTDSSGGYIRGW